MTDRVWEPDDARQYAQTSADASSNRVPQELAEVYDYAVETGRLEAAAWISARTTDAIPNSVRTCLKCGNRSVVAHGGGWKCRDCGADDAHATRNRVPMRVQIATHIYATIQGVDFTADSTPAADPLASRTANDLADAIMGMLGHD